MYKKLLFGFMAITIVFAVIGCDSEVPEEKTFTVSFDTNGGTPATIAAVKVKENGTLGNKFPTAPTNSNANLAFDGWYDEDDTEYENEFFSNTPITKDITLKAKWRNNSTTEWLVSFDTNGADSASISDVLVTKGQSLDSQFPAAPTKARNRFDGWYASDDDTYQTPYDATTAITKNITLKAKWVAIVYYIVEFDTNGGIPDTIAQVEVEENTALGASFPAQPTHSDPTNWGFGGWFASDDDDHLSPFTSTTPITKSLTLKVHWNNTSIAFWEVDFDTNGADSANIAAIEVTKGQGMGSQYPTPDPTKALFRFDGWYASDDDTYQTPYDATTAITKDITLKAKWTYAGGTPTISGDTLVHADPLMTAGLSFAGTIPQNNTDTISWTAGAFQYQFPTTVNGSPINISDYAYFRVLFTGSATSGTGTGVRINQYGTTTEYGGEGDLKAFWMGNVSNSNSTGLRYLVSGAGSTGGFAVQFANDTAVTLQVRITNITFYKATEYTVSFDANGGNSVADVKVYDGFTMGSRWPAPTHPTAGMTFRGWKDASDNYVTATTVITGNLNLTADWMVDPATWTDWYELITTRATSAPVYGFALPDGKKIGDYDRIICDVKRDVGTQGRLRAWGPYVWGENRTAGFIFNNGVCSTWPSMGNSAQTATGGGLLFCQGAWGNIGGTTTTWASVTSTTFDSTRNTTLNQTNGIVLIAFGYIANQGGSDSRSYYIKNIRLQSGTDTTSAVYALNPYDSRLWDGAGGSAFVSQDASVVTRVINEGTGE